MWKSKGVEKLCIFPFLHWFRYWIIIYLLKWARNFPVSVSEIDMVAPVLGILVPCTLIIILTISIYRMRTRSVYNNPSFEMVSISNHTSQMLIHLKCSWLSSCSRTSGGSTTLACLHYGTRKLQQCLTAWSLDKWIEPDAHHVREAISDGGSYARVPQEATDLERYPSLWPAIGYCLENAMSTWFYIDYMI